MKIDHIDFSLLNRMHLEGILIEDQHGDTVLFAGDLKVRITDWFIFKKHAELKYVGLENALVKFQRYDSVWRQQFIFDSFGSSSSDTSESSKGGLQIDLKKLELKNVTFLKKDAWQGEDLRAHVGMLNLDADKLSLSGNHFDINSLVIIEPVVAINKYTGRKPEKKDSGDDTEDEMPKPETWNAGKTFLRVGNLKILNGTFSTDKEGNEPVEYFDGKHILFTAINGEWSDARFEGDTVKAKMHLSTKERSGFEVKNMVADVKMTPQGMAFSNMEIITNRSKIRSFYSMSYNDFSDFGDYISKIKMAAIFEDSYIDSDDIAYFAPKLGSWKKKISLNGKVRGTVDDMVGKDMLVEAGSSTLFSGDISLTGLPDINRTFIDFHANDFRTTYGDAVTIIPAIRKVTSPDLRKLQYVNFKGNFTGFIRDFVTFGTIQTNLGTLVSDLNMKLPAGQEPVYSGNIATDNFKLGYFLDDKTLGDVALKAVIKGRGFNEKVRMVNFDGTIQYADFNGYRYHNIVVDGMLDKQMFEGTASIKDENADMRLNGIIDFNSKAPRFNLQANVTRALLYKLGLTNDSLSFSGKANLDFTSDKVDNFLGTARITEAELKKGEQRLAFDSLVITSGYEGGIKKLTVGSNEISGNITGNFNLKDLPSVATYYLHKYYPAYIKAPKYTPKDQSFTFNIDTYYVDEYLQLVNPHLSGFNGSKLSGSIDMKQNKLELAANVPQFKFRGYNFDFVNINAAGDADSLVLAGEASNIRINDSLNIPHAVFNVRAHNDSSLVSVLTGASQAVEKADLHALVLTYNDGVKIEFEPSTFTINSKTWTIGENGELVLRSSTPASAQLLLTEGQEQIMVQTQPAKSGKGNDITIKLKDVNLGDFSPYFMPKNRLEGLLSGNILVEDPTGNMKITSDDIQTRFLRLDNDSLGEVKASVAYDGELKQLKVKGNTINQENYLGFDANIFFDKDKAKNNLIALKAKEFQIKVLERFLGNLFSDMRGYLTGDVNISGEFDALSVTGKGRLRNAGLKVNFTQCFYWIHDTDIDLTPYEIKLDGIVLEDSVTKNPIYLVGGIEHQSFKNMFYNLDITTRKPGTRDENNNRPVQLLNTTYRDNKQFYGNVKGTGSLSLIGPQSDMYMKIDAVASETDSSYVTIPPSSNRESGIADFLVERKYGREMEASDVTSNTNIIYDVDLTVNKTPVPMVSVRVILDDLTGDEIKGKGNGSLNIISGTTEPLSLRGRFDIEEGSYLFTFQSFFKKPFELKKDAHNYIEWNGDPYDANIKFDAIYRAERVSFAPLADLLQTKSARGDVYVVASLSDKLFKPSISFSLDFPNTSVAVTDPELALIIQQLLKNPNEVNRQVTYLIVFNSFAPSELTGTSSSYSVTELGLTTISGILLNVLSDQINKILSNLLKSDKYNISLNTSIYNRNIISGNTKLELGSNINFSIGRSFFNNRFIISTGLGFDAPLQQSSGQQAFSQQLLPDVVLEWLINPSGSIRASFFYRENTDYLTTSTSGGPGKARRIGANISYRRDFDRLGDIFKGKKKKAKTKPEEVPPSSPAADDKKTVEVKKDGEE